LSKRKTNDEFLNEVFKLVGNEYKVISKYIDAKTKIEIIHMKCNTKYEVSPNSFLSGRRCPYCTGKLMNHDEFVKKVYNLVGNEYEVIGTYKKSSSKLKMKHNICNHTYEVKPNNFLNGRRCPKCFKRNDKKSHEKFVEEVFNLVSNEYEVLSEYKNSKTKIKMKHNICGTVYNVHPVSFLGGCRCPKCAKNMKKTNDIFKKEIHDIVEDEYEVLEDYINDATKIKFRHNLCGHEWNISPNSFLKGTRCPFCNCSKGEKKIKDFFDKNNVDYLPQYKFDDCKNKFSLPFDFAVIDKQNNLMCLIEYDGIQHFEPVKHFGGNERFEVLKFLDSIKNEYCFINNIPLLRIPYWKFDNIEKELSSYLN
jgi:hypothetical protein